MIKIFISSVTFVLLVALIVFVIRKIPQIQAFSDCYTETHLIYTEKYIISRRAYTSEEEICKRNKQQVLKGAECFYREESRMEALGVEMRYMKEFAETITKASREVDEVVADHNRRCDFEESKIDEYELREKELKYSF